MKKSFVYLTLPILLSLYACNNNTGSQNVTDTTTTLNANTDSMAMGDTAFNDSTDTATTKSVTRIDASEVPNTVITAFNSKYSGVTNVKWIKGENKRGKIIYRAHWQLNGKKMMAMFSDDGSFIKEKQLN